MSVAVSCTVPSTSSVGRVRAHATVRLHGHEIQSTVDAALDSGEIDIKRELVPSKGEHLVCVLVLHEVETGTNVGAILVLSHERESQSITAGGSTVGGIIGCSFDRAVLRAVSVAGANRGPVVAVVTVLITADYEESVTQRLKVDDRGHLSYHCAPNASWRQ